KVASEKTVKVRICAQSGPPMCEATRIATRNAPAAKNALCIVVETNSSARKKKPTRVQIHHSIEIFSGAGRILPQRPLTRQQRAFMLSPLQNSRENSER